MTKKSKFLKSAKFAIASVVIASGLSACSMTSEKHKCASKEDTKSEKANCSGAEKASCAAKEKETKASCASAEKEGKSHCSSSEKEGKTHCASAKKSK